MRFGLTLSILLHALVIACFVVTTRHTLPVFDDTQDVPVEVVTVAPQANVKAVTPQIAPDEQLAEPPPQLAPPPPPAMAELTPPEEAAPPAPPVPAPATKPPEKPKQEMAQVRPQMRPTPPHPPDETKEQKFDTDQIQALIDRSKEAKDKEIKTAQASPSSTSGKPQAQVGAGTDMTQTLINLMQHQVARCWSFPAGAVRPEDLGLTITIYLKRDGTLSEPPIIDDQARYGNDSDTYFHAAADAAVRAINECAPYDLPADQYDGPDGWNAMDLRFDPRKMLGY